MARSAKALPTEPGDIKTMYSMLEDLTERVNELHELLAELVERLTEAQRYKDY